MKSWSRLPSFFDRRRFFACLTTVWKSFTNARPSEDSLFDGLLSAFDARKLFKATSI